MPGSARRQTCTDVAGGTITAAGRCFLHGAHHARVGAYEFAHVEAFDTTTVAIDGDAHVRASAGVHITGEHQSTNLSIDTRPISRLADHLNR
ncbi:hypothetical protein [Rhodococcus sp. IEGM 1379]|uniref:hypothetical protein n=1 Tax=Rhodococcus sp. IEGM 1379 TaxID=3047086 RepID=UPI0024B86FB8|nr:hypothetical protein [Rhodococcus sp. IEGM 1379]MDI9916842.1 hypothetical protein [Rhodococcus sp. IEGM 1379]